MADLQELSSFHVGVSFQEANDNGYLVKKAFVTSLAFSGLSKDDVHAYLDNNIDGYGEEALVLLVNTQQSMMLNCEAYMRHLVKIHGVPMPNMQKDRKMIAFQEAAMQYQEQTEGLAKIVVKICPTNSFVISECRELCFSSAPTSNDETYIHIELIEQTERDTSTTPIPEDSLEEVVDEDRLLFTGTDEDMLLSRFDAPATPSDDCNSATSLRSNEKDALDATFTTGDGEDEDDDEIILFYCEGMIKYECWFYFTQF